MEIFVLGSGGMMPMPERALSAFILRRDNSSELLLFDCGEGTQVQLKRLGLGWGALERVFISHTHADHVTGLPGLIMLISQTDRERPLHIYGPPRIRDYVDSLAVLEPVLSFPLCVHELEDEGVACEAEEYRVECRWLKHRRPCLGYRLCERERPGRFDTERAAALNVPRGPERAKLVQGESITLADGRRVSPDEVVGPPRAGLKVAFVTDTRPCPGAVELARDADLFICEGMFDDEHAEDAKSKMHLTASEAAHIAAEAGAKRLALTHISPRFMGRAARALQQEARAAFPRAWVVRDLETIRLPLPR